MQISLIRAGLILAFALSPINGSSLPAEPVAPATQPLAPDASAQPPDAPNGEATPNAAKTVSAPLIPAAPAASPAPGYPARIHIPSIRVNSPILRVGVNEKGEMDVPVGDTNYVGWYKSGTLPGNTGSAVMDAHVYAAFKKLQYVKVGDHIYIDTAENKRLDFVVIETRAYPVSEVPLEALFNRADDERLNLITCEGRFIPAKNTYSHRRVVYATLVSS